MNHIKLFEEKKWMKKAKRNSTRTHQDFNPDNKLDQIEHHLSMAKDISISFIKEFDNPEGREVISQMFSDFSDAAIHNWE